MKTCKYCGKLFEHQTKHGRVCPICKKRNHELRWNRYYCKKGKEIRHGTKKICNVY